jgi:glycosyltransferase involved in cell wall biosynthesis
MDLSATGNELKVIVDGIVYLWEKKGGISRIFSEILPRMCEMDKSLRIELLTAGKMRQSLPSHSRIFYHTIPHIKRYRRPRRVWRPIVPIAERLIRRLMIGRGEGQIWHSTYFTQPGRWDGFQVVTVHDMIFERFSDLYRGPDHNQFRAQKRRCLQRSDATICVSNVTRQELMHFYGIKSDTIYVIPLACSDVFRQLEQCNDRLDIATKRPFLLFIGGRHPHKNFNGLIQAYSLWARREEVALVVVGSPWSVDEEKRLAELGIQDRVHLLTDVDDEALCHLYNQAATFVYPSLYEGFGIPLLEAMACGCPVIASRIPSTIEVAGGCPIYFEPTEVDGLVDALDVALSEGHNSERVRAGIERVKRYSWDRVAAQTLEVYRTLL